MDVFAFYKGLNLKTSSDNDYIKNIAKKLYEHEVLLECINSK